MTILTRSMHEIQFSCFIFHCRLWKSSPEISSRSKLLRHKETEKADGRSNYKLNQSDLACRLLMPCTQSICQCQKTINKNGDWGGKKLKNSLGSSNKEIEREKYYSMKRQSKRFEKLLVYSPRCCSNTFAARLQPILRLVHATRRRLRLRKPFWRLIVKVTIRAKSHSPNRMNDDLRLRANSSSSSCSCSSCGFAVHPEFGNSRCGFTFRWQIGKLAGRSELRVSLKRRLRLKCTDCNEWMNWRTRGGDQSGDFAFRGAKRSRTHLWLADCEIVAAGRHTRSWREAKQPSRRRTKPGAALGICRIY